MRYCSPDDIVRWRRRFNDPKYDPNYPNGRYLATDENIIKKRRQRVPEMQAELGYGGGSQDLAINNNQLNNNYKNTIK